MKRISPWMLVWIVTWKVVVHHGAATVERSRTAKFAEKGTAIVFMQSQGRSHPGREFTLTEKS